MPCYVKTFVTGDTTVKGFQKILSILKKKNESRDRSWDW